MNLKCRLILEDYRKQRNDFIKLGDTVHTMLSSLVKELGLTVLAVEHRVKEEKSLAGKLERKGDLYNTLEDITDIAVAQRVGIVLDALAFNGKRSRRKAVQTADDVEQRRFTAAASTKDGDHAPLRQL